MEFWFWFIIFVLFIMLMNAKSDINRLERQLNELAKRLKTIMPPAETEAEKRPEEKDDAEKQTAIQLPPLPQPAAGTSAPLPQKQPRRPQTPDNGDGVNITFLGQKLITWIAGFAAVLGFFYFIRYSIENGLLGPVARLTAATLGGLLLTGAGCLLHYKQNVANHQRIGEALLGAGIAALYFAAYALAKIYQLAPESVSFALMCGITAASIGLTLTVGGQTTAVLALIGGFLTPALTAGSGGISGFCTYLFILTAALLFMSRRLGTILPALLALIGLYSWIGVYLLFYFALNDSFWLFALTVLTAAATAGIFRSGNKTENGNMLTTLSLSFCIVFSFLYLLKTDFGFAEWSVLALMLCGLTALCLFRRQTYFRLLIAADLTTFILLALWDADAAFEKQIFFSLLAAVALLPFYIAAWVRPHKEFLLFPAAAAPLVYALAYFLFSAQEMLPYVGLAAAVAFAAQVCRLNLKEAAAARAAGFLLLSSAALTTMALASLADARFWPVVLSVEILVLAFLRNRLNVTTLTPGIRVGALLFAAVECKNIINIFKLLFLTPLVPVEFYASELTTIFYVSDIIVPSAAFAALAFVSPRGRGRTIAAAAAGLLAFFGLFSFYMLVKMQFAGKISLLPDFADYTLMTNLFLLGALTCAYGSNRLLGKVVFAVGLWRLFALGLLCGSPFFNRVEVFLPGTLFAYGMPMLIFAFCAFKTNGNIRDNFVRMAALMSFILVSAVLTLAFYRRLYLPGIRFDDGSVFAYSAVWLILGCLWLVAAFRCRALVKPAFGLIYFVIAKVFLYDVSSLDGIWRISALFGLAGSLLVISYGYSRWFQPKKETV